MNGDPHVRAIDLHLHAIHFVIEKTGMWSFLAQEKREERAEVMFENGAESEALGFHSFTLT